MLTLSSVGTSAMAQSSFADMKYGFNRPHRKNLKILTADSESP